MDSRQASIDEVYRVSLRSLRFGSVKKDINKDVNLSIACGLTLLMILENITLPVCTQENFGHDQEGRLNCTWYGFGCTKGAKI